MSYILNLNPGLFPNNEDYNESIKQFSEIEINPIVKTPEEYVQDIRQLGVDFPYKRLYFSEKEVKEAFRLIKKFKGRWSHKKYANTDLKDVKFPTDFFLINFEKSVPISFDRARPYIDLDSSAKPIDYNINVIVDYFSEYARIKCSRNKSLSVYDGWLSDDEFLLKLINLSIQYYGKVNGQTLRESIYKTNSYPECPHVKTTFVHNFYSLLLKGVDDPIVLDACAGYGDRLIACIALNFRYVGVEPNTQMRGSFKEIKQVLGRNIHKFVILEDFMPTADVGDEPTYNLCHISPPSFDSEIYEIGSESQSINLFKNRNDWLVYFLFRMINRCWNLLKPNGFLIIESILFEEICCYIRYRFPEALFLGTVSVKTSSRNKPMWIFMKSDRKQLHKNLPTRKRCYDKFNNKTRKRLSDNEDVYYS